jgi:transposase
MGKAYSEEFRNEALKMREEMGRTATAKKLKISVNTIDKWKEAARAGKIKEERTEKAEASKKVKELEEKIKEIEKENARLRKENEFLEEAASFFAVSRQKMKQN